MLKSELALLAEVLRLKRFFIGYPLLAALGA